MVSLEGRVQPVKPTVEPERSINRLMTYNWQQRDWPEFHYDLSGVEDALQAFAQRTGRASGLLSCFLCSNNHLPPYLSPFILDAPMRGPLADLVLATPMPAVCTLPKPL